MNLTHPKAIFSVFRPASSLSYDHDIAACQEEIAQRPDPNEKNDRSALARRDSVGLANSQERLSYRWEPMGCPEDNRLRLHGHPKPHTSSFQGSTAEWRRHPGWHG